MSREKRIEEMARTFCGGCDKCLHGNCTDWYKAEALYDTGYRKQKEGEWISNDLGGYKYAFYCSECGWVDGYPFNDRHKYCPNCGAKMKGGE